MRGGKSIELNEGDRLKMKELLDYKWCLEKIPKIKEGYKFIYFEIKAARPVYQVEGNGRPLDWCLRNKVHHENHDHIETRINGGTFINKIFAMVKFKNKKIMGRDLILFESFK